MLPDPLKDRAHRAVAALVGTGLTLRTALAMPVAGAVAGKPKLLGIGKPRLGNASED